MITRTMQIATYQAGRYLRSSATVEQSTPFPMSRIRTICWKNEMPRLSVPTENAIRREGLWNQWHPRRREWGPGDSGCNNVALRWNSLDGIFPNAGGDKITSMRGALFKASWTARAHRWPGSMSNWSSHTCAPAAFKSSASRRANSESSRL